ncbi:cyclic-phosphate processing receiver domain-containing protein [Paludisphaera mucosa]|uniref:Cyclic-phosphate processing Receiver domain-containing protein n=1 Tax=Paludisphaera mucosa TaxID=3030827 RepID=A0ABT6F820_9BACT|nr:cyclic-phosphate processing receiver domain-containing protein [Paludisphaera mucosa]MDG3003742.1 hypothetical protein [Paludisphaera mucosa]
MIEVPRTTEADVPSSPVEAAPATPDGGVAPEPRLRRILFLDDDPRRAEVFLVRCPQAIWVMTADDCIARLAEAWDEVHLDHDLGGERYVDVNRNDCGMAVVRWICAEERGPVRSARFFIHSYNFAAASLMVECLLQNGYAAEFRPFGFDLVDFLSFEPPPPPRRTFWRRLAGFWRRLVGGTASGSLVTASHVTGYDRGPHPAGLDPQVGRGSAATSEKQP